MSEFKLVADFAPTGDQPQAVDDLIVGLKDGTEHQTLLGVTGSGKTFTMACVIEKIQRPTLVLAHNKTLAAQLSTELQGFFPENAVEYFVSYYDYYQPEAYVPRTDTFIEKDADVNEQLDKLRHSATVITHQKRRGNCRFCVLYIRPRITRRISRICCFSEQGRTFNSQ